MNNVPRRTITPGADYVGIGVGVLIFNDLKQVLLILRSGSVRNDKNKWSIPGGEIEYNELSEAAIIRETKGGS